MSRRVSVKGVVKKSPDLRLYAMALIQLARQLAEEEARLGLPAEKPNPPEVAV